ncbi:PaaI family thioesterase [Archaeoglobus sp.]
MNLNADKFRDFLGIKVLEVKEGYAKVVGKVRENFLNFHGTAHGSYIMALADAAFALAANSDGKQRVALSIKINFHKPAFEGDELIGEAKATKKGRIMFCDLKITRDGEIVAEGDAIAVAVEK